MHIKDGGSEVSSRYIRYSDVPGGVRRTQGSSAVPLPFSVAFTMDTSTPRAVHPILSIAGGLPSIRHRPHAETPPPAGVRPLGLPIEALPRVRLSDDRPEGTEAVRCAAPDLHSSSASCSKALEWARFSRARRLPSGVSGSRSPGSAWGRRRRPSPGSRQHSRQSAAPSTDAPSPRIQCRRGYPC